MTTPSPVAVLLVKLTRRGIELGAHRMADCARGRSLICQARRGTDRLAPAVAQALRDALTELKDSLLSTLYSLLDKAHVHRIMNPMATISDQVIRAINECGMTRYQLAKMTGVSEGELSRVVAGQRSMTLRTLDRLAPAIGVRITVKRARKRKKKGM